MMEHIQMFKLIDNSFPASCAGPGAAGLAPVVPLVENLPMDSNCRSALPDLSTKPSEAVAAPTELRPPAQLRESAQTGFKSQMLLLVPALLLCAAQLQAQPVPKSEASAAGRPVPGGSAALALEALVRQVRESNRMILGKQAERDLALSGIDRARSVFQPTTGLAVTNGQQRQANTYEEQLIRNNQGIYQPI